MTVQGEIVPPVRRGNITSENAAVINPKPFRKDDANGNINKHGATKKSVRQFANTFKDMLVEEGLRPWNPNDPTSMTRIQRVVERIYDEAEAGEAWAVQVILERVEGKVPTTVVPQDGDVAVLVIRGASMDDL